jgi:hypothetical protein
VQEERPAWALRTPWYARRVPNAFGRERWRLLHDARALYPDGMLRSRTAFEGALARAATFAITRTPTSRCRPPRSRTGLPSANRFSTATSLALVAMLTFLEANGYRVQAPDPELADWMIGLSGEFTLHY